MNELQQLRDEITQLNTALTIKNGTIAQLKARNAQLEDRNAALAVQVEARQVPEDARMRAAAEMNRLGYGYHESHAASILIAAVPAQPAAQGQKEVQRLREALAGLLAIVDDSRGVAGYHLNGAIADWDEFPEVESARAMLAAAPKESTHD